VLFYGIHVIIILSTMFWGVLLFYIYRLTQNKMNYIHVYSSVCKRMTHASTLTSPNPSHTQGNNITFLFLNKIKQSFYRIEIFWVVFLYLAQQSLLSEVNRLTILLKQQDLEIHSLEARFVYQYSTLGYYKTCIYTNWYELNIITYVDFRLDLIGLKCFT
jgi:hypothetical protein